LREEEINAPLSWAYHCKPVIIPFCRFNGEVFLHGVHNPNPDPDPNPDPFLEE